MTDTATIVQRAIASYERHLATGSPRAAAYWAVIASNAQHLGNDVVLAAVVRGLTQHDDVARQASLRVTAQQVTDEAAAEGDDGADKRRRVPPARVGFRRGELPTAAAR